MSARKSFLRRSRSAARQCRSAGRRAPARRRSAMALMSSCCCRRRRECRPRPRRTASAPGRPRAARRARRRRWCESSAGLAGLQISVATRDMRVNSSGDASKAVLIAGPTASGKSALALELAQSDGGIVINADSMQVYRDLRVHHGAADAGGGGAGAAPALRPCRCRREFFGRRLGGGCGEGAGGGARARPPADLRRRLRALFQGADARAVGGAADSGGGARGRARAAGARRRRGAACRTGAARSASRPNG